MSEIRDTASALTEAERILTRKELAIDAVGVWVSLAVAPLAALLWFTADPGSGQIDLERAQAAAAVTVDLSGSGDNPSWVQAARFCPDRRLGESLARVLTMDVRQRDSIQAVIVEALNI